MRVILLLAVVGAAFAAIPREHPMFTGGVPRGSNRIVGGAPTTIDRYPYIVNFHHLFAGFIWISWCGGSLLTSRTILSAAHCFAPNNPSGYRIRAGSSFTSSGGALHAVESIRLHERYNIPTAIDNDVAIIRLIFPVEMSETVQAARVAGLNYILADNTQVVTLGWGALTPGGSSPEQLHAVDIYIINQQICAERYDYLRTQPNQQNTPHITENMICAGVLDVGGRDACQGDSGGPLAHDGDVLVGVVSWGYSCAHYYYPGVNARVSTLSPWIAEHGAG